MLGTFLELRRFGIGYKRKIHEVDPAVGYVCSLEAFVRQKLRVGKKFPLPSLGAQNANALLSLRHRRHGCTRPRRSLEYPCPFIAPETHRQLM